MADVLQYQNFNDFDNDPKVNDIEKVDEGNEFEQNEEMNDPYKEKSMNKQMQQSNRRKNVHEDVLQNKQIQRKENNNLKQWNSRIKDNKYGTYDKDMDRSKLGSLEEQNNQTRDLYQNPNQQFIPYKTREERIKEDIETEAKYLRDFDVFKEENLKRMEASFVKDKDGESSNPDKIINYYLHSTKLDKAKKNKVDYLLSNFREKVAKYINSHQYFEQDWQNELLKQIKVLRLENDRAMSKDEDPMVKAVIDGPMDELYKNLLDATKRTPESSKKRHNRYSSMLENISSHIEFINSPQRHSLFMRSMIWTFEYVASFFGFHGTNETKRRIDEISKEIAFDVKMLTTRESSLNQEDKIKIYNSLINNVKKAISDIELTVSLDKKFGDKIQFALSNELKNYLNYLMTAKRNITTNSFRLSENITNRAETLGIVIDFVGLNTFLKESPDIANQYIKNKIMQIKKERPITNKQLRAIYKSLLFTSVAKDKIAAHVSKFTNDMTEVEKQECVELVSEIRLGELSGKENLMMDKFRETACDTLAKNLNELRDNSSIGAQVVPAAEFQKLAIELKKEIEEKRDYLYTIAKEKLRDEPDNIDIIEKELNRKLKILAKSVEDQCGRLISEYYGRGFSDIESERYKSRLDKIQELLDFNNEKLEQKLKKDKDPTALFDISTRGTEIAKEIKEKIEKTMNDKKDIEKSGMDVLNELQKYWKNESEGYVHLTKPRESKIEQKENRAEERIAEMQRRELDIKEKMEEAKVKDAEARKIEELNERKAKELLGYSMFRGGRGPGG